ncbi:unnamed protein product [Eruca vesicaria subsp. sativa]|uniref:Uncharacterized protein n=1 Tax=Eruca vesicaria subsp. sativa TaxID=29727 RepID=A0ABC8JUI2_ERUVS|nr:unnamed protein product [Eruca vesicaria subsp. sativa]
MATACSTREVSWIKRCEGSRGHKLAVNFERVTSTRVVLEWWWMWWRRLMITLLMEIGLAGWIWVEVSDLGSGYLGVISVAPTSTIYGFFNFQASMFSTVAKEDLVNI